MDCMRASTTCTLLNGDERAIEVHVCLRCPPLGNMYSGRGEGTT